MQDPIAERSNRHKRYLCAREAATHLGVSVSWLYARLNEGNGPPRVKKAGRNLFPIDGLDEWARTDDDASEV